MNLFDLYAKLSLDSSDFVSGIQTASKIGVAAIGAIVTASLAIAGAMTKAVSSVADYGDNIDKMSQKLNMSSAAYQEWDAVMQHCGTSVDSLQSSMKTLANAAETNNDAFKRLGITQEDIAGMSNEQLFSATITALQGVEDETERTYLAGKLLGRGATELGALLNLSAEETQALKDRVHELGGVMSDEAIKAAAAYKDSLQDMQTAFTGMSRNFVSTLLPGFTRVMDGLTEIFAGNTDAGVEIVSDGIDNIIQTIDTMLPQVVDTFGKLLSGIGQAVQKNLGKIVSTGAQIVGKLAKGLLSAAPEIAKTAMKLVSQLASDLRNSLPQMIPAAVEILMQLVETLTDPTNLSALTQAAVDIITGLANGLIQALPVLVDRIPQVVDNIILGIEESLPKIVEALGQIFVSIVDFVLDPANQAQILTAVGQIALSIVNGLADITWNLAEVAGNFLDALVAALAEAAGLGALYDAGKGVFGEFVRGLRETAETGEFSSLISEVYSQLSTDLSNADSLKDIYEAGAKAVRTFVQGMAESMPELWGLLKGIFGIQGNSGMLLAMDELEKSLGEGGEQAFGNAAERLKNSAGTFFGDALGEVAKSVENAFGEESGFSKLAEQAEKGMQEMAEAVEAGAEPVAAAAENVAEAGVNALDVSGQTEGIGKAFIDGFASGLSDSDALSRVMSAASAAAEAAAKILRDKLKIKSPSRLTREFGQFFTEGFSLGIVDELSGVEDAAERAAGAAISGLQEFDGNLIGGSAASGTASSSNGLWGEVTKLLGEIRDKTGGNVVLDGRIVGYLDEALGDLSMRKARGGGYA